MWWGTEGWTHRGKEGRTEATATAKDRWLIYCDHMEVSADSLHVFLTDSSIGVEKTGRLLNDVRPTAWLWNVSAALSVATSGSAYVALVKNLLLSPAKLAWYALSLPSHSAAYRLWEGQGGRYVSRLSLKPYSH